MEHHYVKPILFSPAGTFCIILAPSKSLEHTTITRTVSCLVERVSIFGWQHSNVVWCRSITKENLFEPVFSVFLENGPRYNMLNSSETLNYTHSLRGYCVT